MNNITNNNDTGIGVSGGQVVKPQNPLDLFASPPTGNATLVSIDSSPTLTNFSTGSNDNFTISGSDKLKSPTNLVLCSVIMFIVAGLWMSAGYFIQALTPVYDSSGMLTYLSVISLQIYFFFIPKRPMFPKRRSDGTIIVDECDLGFDTYTNREAFKIAGYLFILFTVSIGLIIKGLSLFPQSSYSGSVGYFALFTLIFMITGMKTESITRYKIVSIVLMAVAAGITMLEPVLWDNLDLSSLLNYGLAFSIGGILLLALFFVILNHNLEHTNIHKPMLFGFIGLFCMLFMWLAFIPLHAFNWEPLTFPPPQEEVYWYIIGIVTFGTVIPFYLIQWVLTRTSILFVGVSLGAIIPLHGVAESIYFLEWNWVNLFGSLFSVAALLCINYKYK